MRHKDSYGPLSQNQEATIASIWQPKKPIVIVDDQLGHIFSKSIYPVAFTLLLLGDILSGQPFCHIHSTFALLPLFCPYTLYIFQYLTIMRMMKGSSITEHTFGSVLPLILLVTISNCVKCQPNRQHTKTKKCFTTLCLPDKYCQYWLVATELR